MNLEDQVKHYKELSLKIEELEEEKKALSLAIMQQMQSSTLQIPGFLVRKISRLSIKLTIEQARTFNAVQLIEAVDKDKIKALVKNGQPIEGVHEIQYIQVQNK